MQSVKEIMTGYGSCHWKHGSSKIAVVLILMGFLPACDRAGNAPASRYTAKAGAGGKKAEAAFKVRHAIFQYRAHLDRLHPYDQPVVEKRIVVLT